MIRTHNFDWSINPTEPITFVIDKEANCFNELVKTFVGKCYQNKYIISIDNINKISNCEIYQRDESARGKINVNFNATIFETRVGNILPCCKVTEKTLENIYLESNFDHDTMELVKEKIKEYSIDITNKIKISCINDDKYWSSIKVGQYVPIEVLASNYQLFTDFISIIGRIFIGFNQDDIPGTLKYYTVSNNTISEEEIKILTDIIEMNIDKNVLTKDKNVKHFLDLLSTKNINDANNTYKINDKECYVIKNNADLLSFIKLIKNDEINPLMLCYSDLSELKIYKLDNKIIDTNMSQISITLFMALFNIIIKYVNIINVIDEWSIIFSDNTLMKSHQNIWLLIQKYK